MYKLIAEVFEDLKPPECLLQRFKSNDDEMSDKSAICETKTTGMDCDTNPSISKSEKPVIVFTDVYKYRTSRDKRAFIPPTVNKSSQVSQALSDEFIALGSDFDPVDDKYFTTVKSKRYVNISKKKKHTEESENIEKNQSSKKLKLIDNADNAVKHTKNNTLNRHRNDKPNYLSLKLKRIQGNDKRRKATKLAKKKR